MFYAFLVNGFLEDHVEVVECHFNGQGMTIAWTIKGEIEGVQVEYQCFNESLENVSQLNQVSEQIPPPMCFVGTYLLLNLRCLSSKAEILDNFFANFSLTSVQ